MTGDLAHLATWIDADGSTCVATWTPWRDGGGRRYVARIKALPAPLRRWSPDLGVWLVASEAAADVRTILADVFGADVCPVCLDGEPCDLWRTIDDRARRLRLGRLAGASVAANGRERSPR